MIQIRLSDGQVLTVQNTFEGEAIHRDSLFDYDMPWRVNKHMMEFFNESGDPVVLNMSYVTTITGL